MYTKIESLEKDIERLKYSLNEIEGKLRAMDNDANCDHGLVKNYIKEKNEIMSLLDSMSKQLEEEEHKCKSKPIDQHDKVSKEEYERRNRMYASVRSNYIKHTDN